MKRTSSLFEKIVSYENVRLAYLKARKGKTSKKSIRNFAKNVNENLFLVQKNLKSNPPVLSKYTQFKITDPKERIISVVPFLDRVMHHAIINILEPIFERQFIFHTYACRKEKGTHAAARYALKKAKSSKYFLKLDVKKYFDSINHAILKSFLTRIIKDGRCLSLLFSVIDSYSSSFSYKNKQKGLPIGNLTSQFFANFYLSPLDHYVLEKMKPKGYVRYMDDIVVFSDSKSEVKNIFCLIKKFCREKLLLVLKQPILGNCKSGVPFLGWRISSCGIYVLQKTKRRMKSKLRLIQRECNSGRITEEKASEKSCAVLACRKI